MWAMKQRACVFLPPLLWGCQSNVPGADHHAASHGAGHCAKKEKQCSVEMRNILHGAVLSAKGIPEALGATRAIWRDTATVAAILETGVGGAQRRASNDEN